MLEEEKKKITILPIANKDNSKRFETTLTLTSLRIINVIIYKFKIRKGADSKIKVSDKMTKMKEFVDSCDNDKEDMFYPNAKITSI